MENLCINSTTGICNLIGLFESNIKDICGDSGTVLFMDMIKLSVVNRDLGMQIGDFYIKSVAETIIEEVSALASNSLQPTIYHIGCDRFLVLFPSELDLNVNELAERIDTSVKQKMSQYNIKTVGIYFAPWIYSEGIYSPSSLLKQCYISLHKKYSPNESVDTNLPVWADNLIDNMFHYIKDTFSLMQHKDTLANTDEISQLLNHRSANFYIKDSIENFNLYKKPFCLLFIDGDNLKRYNDISYQQGNEMIRNLAMMITDSARMGDKIFRWLSGDEFLVLIKDTDKDSAHIIAERIRSNIEIETKSWRFPVTVSIGIATCPLDGIDFDTLIRKAEIANVKAKKSGKNCVI